ncbi:sulfotransferase domain-containing protein [Candidatus Methylocalor cossyra]|uniref:Sulfotransferase domain protein n=1 Tax=Candidatus Methylocalor cossyra TaxID=3108543 RepID=A0ABM9NG38_9GAMM
MNSIVNKSLRRLYLLGKTVRWGMRPCPAGARETRLIAGAQRSGTNLVMDILERSWEADVYHESDPRAFQVYRMRPLPIIQELRKRSRAKCFILKALCESQDLPELMEQLAPAKAVWVLRNYNDVVNSMVISFPRTHEDLQRIAQDRKLGGWRTEGMSEQTYRLVSGLVKRHGDALTNASASALQWYFRNVLYFEKGFYQHPDIKLLRYEDLVTQPQRTVSGLFEFFGLPYHPWVHGMVFSSSLRKRPAPELLPEVAELCEKLWQRFQELEKPQSI